MKRTGTVRTWGMARILNLAVLLSLIGVTGAYAEAPAVARPATLEQQTTHLEGALAESLRTRDWKMLEMSVQGFKAVNLSGPAAEISFLHSERQAAWENAQNTRPAQMETWGLAARAKFGDAKALAALRTIAATPPAAVQLPAATLWKTNPAEAKAAQKAYATYMLAVEKHDHATLCMALLKESGIGQSALSSLHTREKAASSFMGMGMGTDSSSQLVLAALAADPQAGWKGLLEYCGADEEKIAVDVQTAAFNFLLSLANPPKFQTADARDFVFVFVGSFDLAKMKPLVERYLGSLPSLHRNEAVKDVGMHPPADVVDKQVRSGIEPRSQVSIVFSGPFVNDETHRVIASAMADTLGGNLQRTLREDLGGTYGVSVEPSFTKRPTEEYRLAISFACDPARTDALVNAAFDVIARFKTLGPGASQVADARAGLTRDFETNSERNDYLLNRILFKYEYGEDIKDVFDMRPYYNQVSVATLRDAARQYLNTNRYVKVTLLPVAP